MKRIVCLLAATSILFITAQSRADNITGHFSIKGSITNNNVYPTSGGPDTLTFSDVTNASDPLDSTGTFALILTPSESAVPSGGTIPFTPNGTYNYSGAYFNFGTGTDELLVQLLSLTESTTPDDGTGLFFYDYSGNVIFSTPNDSTYTPTDGTFSFTSQDERIGPVTFSATGYAASVTPEPSSLLFLATGLVGAAGMVRRRLQK